MFSLLRRVVALLFLVVPHLVHAQETSGIEKFALRFIEAEKTAWEQGEFDALMALEHPDVVFQNIDGTVFRGWDEHRKAIEDTKASFNGAPITQEWQYLMGEGNVFAVSYRWTVHLPGEPLDIVGIAVGRLENGKLEEEWGAGYTAAPENGG